MSTNDMAQDSKIVPNDKGKLAKVELTDIWGRDKIAALDIDVPAEVNVSDERKFTKLELTQGQQMQISGLMNQLPDLLNAASLSKTVRLTFPKGVQGSLMALKNGGYSTTLVDEAGKIVGTASISVPTFQTAALGAVTVMSIASGQYFLAQINNKLGQISSKLDKILKFLDAEKRAELLSEVNFINFSYQNYKSVMEHSEQRIATLANLQSAKKVAMKNIEFYLNNLKEVSSEKKKDAEEMLRIHERLELSLQLYAMSNLLEVYYSENFDSNYIGFINNEASTYIGTCIGREHGYFITLQNALLGAKNQKQEEQEEQVKQVNAIVDELDKKIILSDPLLTALKSVLDETSQKKQYYLTRDSEGCKVYLLNAS